MNRRGFLRRIATAAAAIAAAPVILREVIAAKLDDDKLNLRQYLELVYQIAEKRKPSRHIEFFVDAEYKKQFDLAILRYYQENCERAD